MSDHRIRRKGTIRVARDEASLRAGNEAEPYAARPIDARRDLDRRCVVGAPERIGVEVGVASS